MKKKKQMKIIFIFTVLLTMILGSWWLMQTERLKSAEVPEPLPSRILNPDLPIEIPDTPPGNLNAMDLSEGFTIVRPPYVNTPVDLPDTVVQLGAKIFDPKEINPEQYPINWKNTVQMVQPFTMQRGAIWYNEPISLEKPFSGSFELYLGNNTLDRWVRLSEGGDLVNLKNTRMADGVTFTLQNDSLDGRDPLTAIGSSSRGFGASGHAVPQLRQGYIQNALSLAIGPLANIMVDWLNSGSVSVGFPTADIGLLPIERDTVYNTLSGTRMGNITDGSWLKIDYKWDSAKEIFSYQIFDEKHFGPNSGLIQEINFQTAKATSRQYMQDDDGNYAPSETETIVDIPQLQSKENPIAGEGIGAEEYFKGKKVYWGFTGATSGALAPNNVQPLNPIVSIGETPNQSQSPLKLSMQKLGEIDRDGKRQPLAGAKFILQKQDAETKTWKQVIPDGVSGNDLKDLVFTTDDSGEIIVSAFDEHGVLQKTQQQLIENITANSASYRFREVAVPKDSSYVQPPTIPNQDPENFVYSGEEPEHSATLFSTAAKLLNGNSTTTESQDDGYFGEVYNNTPPTIELTKLGVESKPLSGVESKPLSGVEMTIGAKVTDETTNKQKVMSLAQLANEVKKTTTYQDTPLRTNESGKITVPTDQIPLMMDLASSSLDVYKSLDQWVFIETKAVDTYKPSPFSVSNGTFSAQNVSDTYKNKFIFDITTNWTSGDTVLSEYKVTAENALNQFKVQPTAIGPDDVDFSSITYTIDGKTVNSGADSDNLELAVTGGSATTYSLKQTNTLPGYTVANDTQSFTIAQNPAKVNEFTVTIPSVTDDAFAFYYKNDTGTKQKIESGKSFTFTSSNFLTNPILYVEVTNKAGENSLAVTEEINFNEKGDKPHSLPLKDAGPVFPNHDWAITYINNDPNIKNLALKVKLTEPFKNGNNVLDGILRFKSADGEEKRFNYTEDEETLYDKDKLEGLSTTERVIEFAEGSKTGFFLDGAAINAAYQRGEIPPGTSNYQAELTFTLAADPIPTP